jgi:sialate O-acetylesterase
MKKYFALFVLITFVVQSSYSKVKLPAILADHMVLQQQSKVNFWGWCAPNESIVVKPSWTTHTFKTQGSSDGKFLLKIATPKAGGPFTITIVGENEIVLKDVLIGEVWVCGGQSNMEWSGTQSLKQSLEEAPNATNGNIRLLYVPKTTATTPQEDIKATWKVNNPIDMKAFSAIGYFFGKRLNEKLNVPIGLINSNWGGTPAEPWIPTEVIENDSTFKAVAATIPAQPNWPVKPGLAFNGMISPIANFKIAGVIWYQGESNVPTWYNYNRLFATMINSWRTNFGWEMPFYYVQVAPYTYNNGYGALLREAQTQTLSVPKTGMVVISDLVSNVKNIHPENKVDVAHRLANLALDKTYHVAGVKFEQPLFKKAVLKGSTIKIYFEHLGGGLVSKDGPIKEIYIAGADQKFLPAQAKIEGKELVVWSNEVLNPVAVRFGFTDAAVPNLFGSNGLPVNPFRTDQWQVKK